jgi:hypothetical protein
MAEENLSDGNAAEKRFAPGGLAAPQLRLRLDFYGEGRQESPNQLLFQTGDLHHFGVKLGLVIVAVEHFRPHTKGRGLHRNAGM